MSRSKNDGQRGYKEYWSRRPCKLKYKDTGPEAKRATHRAERRAGKQETRHDPSLDIFTNEYGVQVREVWP